MWGRLAPEGRHSTWGHGRVRAGRRELHEGVSMLGALCSILMLITDGECVLCMQA